MIRNPNWKRIHKTSLFADNMILYIENLKDTKKTNKQASKNRPIPLMNIDAKINIILANQI